MLSKELNERLTRVGPGTPMGELMRRYWHPVAAAVELDENPVKKVRLLGEDLVLYRDRSGNLGLIDEPCPHRRVSMEYGIPEEEGLRCPYHGWLFNHTGQCTEQPAEPWNSTFKDRVRTKAYQVQELTGLVFAYLGPDPAPLLPRYDIFVWDNVVRQIGRAILPCNWLQCMENSLDPTHVEWLHGYYMDYVWARKGFPSETGLPTRDHKKIGFDRFEYGIIKRRVSHGDTEESDHWRVGHPIVFPNILRVGSTFQIRVPTDDTTTTHWNYVVYQPGVPVPPQTSVPLYETPLRDEHDKWFTEMVLVQDFFVWASQGAIADRSKEHLGQSDVGIIMFRELLKEQTDRLEAGEEPMNVHRDPAKNHIINLPQEGLAHDRFQPKHGQNMFTGSHGRLDKHTDQSDGRFGPLLKDLLALAQEAERRLAAGETPLPSRVTPIVPVGTTRDHVEVQLLP
ncbi:MAG: aromatic ring-hydroxylating dioxygenase subunit alpha [Chloroflexota bacterium]